MCACVSACVSACVRECSLFYGLLVGKLRNSEGKMDLMRLVAVTLSLLINGMIIGKKRF